MRQTWLRKPAVLDKLGCGTTKLYAAMRYDGFPSPVKLGRASLWSEEEIDSWLGEQMIRRDEVRAEDPAK